MKVLPWAIAGMVFVAVLIGVFIFIPGQVEVPTELGEFFEDCHRGNRDVANMLRAIETRDVSKCSGTGPSFCEAIVLEDESLCPPDSSCRAYVRNDASDCDGDADCLAYLNRDPSACDGAFDPLLDIDLHKSCVAFANRDAGYFSSREADVDCVDSARYWNAATVEDCSSIENDDLRVYCVDFVNGVAVDRKTRVFE